MGELVVERVRKAEMIAGQMTDESVEHVKA